ncbi:glycosyltransferase [Paenibacillus dendritiformis]|uniref:glycosyltransferase n=1 Tax=Paenibacillus dendritiformis TaxID=130049 RepID=UPI00143D49C7|nr:glycosyltransferase [Paenibacillus dendritiformis]NKI20922.1 glycosyltransferase [Paenibacillus dendritiformis]NRG01421.1 glycosyltransferase [Paenibacillus dendritiformis]
MNLVSIILPVYNGSMYLKQAIDSVLKQTYPHIEVIIVDDGSTDDTPNIVKRYKNIKYFRQSNQGPSVARNVGVRLSSGKYIAMMDADDLSTPTRIEEKVKFLEKNPQFDYVYCDVDVIDSCNRFLYRLESEEVFSSPSDALAYILYRQFIPSPSAILSLRKCFDLAPYPEDYTHGEDYFLMIEWTRRFVGAYLPKVLYRYRRHDGNLTNAHNKQMKAEIDIIKNIGTEQIKEIVECSHFSVLDKELLFAKIMMKIGDYYNAEAILSQISQEESDVLFLLGICQYQRYSYTDAMKSFESALMINHGLAEGWNNLGCSLVHLNEVKKAEACFLQAKTIRPEYMDAAWNIEIIKTNKSQLKLTMKPLRKFLTSYEIDEAKNWGI